MLFFIPTIEDVKFGSGISAMASNYLGCLQMTISVSIIHRFASCWRRLQFYPVINSASVGTKMKLCDITLTNNVVHTECTYNTMGADGTVVGGLASNNEMCSGFISYYPAIDFNLCISENNLAELFKDFGMESVEEYENNFCSKTPTTFRKNMFNFQFSVESDDIFSWNNGK